MSKVLYIKANTTPADKSRTFRISDSFIETYRQNNPGDEIIILDLYKEGITMPTEDDVKIIMGPKDAESRNNPVLKYAYQFAEADKYVIAEPMWNLSIPTILKAYIDYISVAEITFRYTKDGPVGLMQGKKAINIVARGGEYSVEPYSSFQMDDKYLRAIFGFYGIRDFTTIQANKLDIFGMDVDSILKKAIEEAEEAAKVF